MGLVGVARAAADGALDDAIFDLSDPQPARRWPLDGRAHILSIGDSRPDEYVMFAWGNRVE